MSPEQLAAWETVLKSPVAVALLLFAAVCVTNGFWVSVVLRLYRQNREQTEAFQEYLLSNNRLETTVDGVRQLTSLMTSLTTTLHDGGTNDGPGNR